ncbi:MAG: DEAD/DEAH box helicase family protein [Bacilli bacterium]|nr:DEAD/DEAH box helicase family protein [Bacilli bacterium]
MSLLDVNLKQEYRSPRDNIVNDFYIPLLKESILYKRSVGFFSSSSLLEISYGISNLINNNGKIQLIASPNLSEEDIEAINKGYELRENIIERVLLQYITEPQNYFEEERLNLVATLIAQERLDIKIAFSLKNNKLGLYHEKLGLMYDKDNNIVAFSGSMNETETAFVSNYEIVDVFTSWNDNARVTIKQNAFDKLWNNEDQSAIIYDFPEVAKNKLLSYKKDFVDWNIDKKEFTTKHIDSTIEKLKTVTNSPEIPAGVSLHDYQKRAIETWKEKKYNGIFDMATGTGKTFTGLGAITQLYKDLKGKLAVIIVCPYQHLVNQWVEDIVNFNINPIIGHSSSEQRDFKQRFKMAIMDYNLGVRNFFCFVCTNGTFATEYIQSQINNIRGDVLLVVDEAHNFGATNLKKTLTDKFNYRLALSATLERHGDAEGTQALLDYFGEKCIEFTLEDAIKGTNGDKFLTPYQYHPVVVYLTDDELEEYHSLSREISKCIIKKNGKIKLSDRGKIIAQKRSRLIAGAFNKVNALAKEIKPYKNDNHILVYCGATKIAEQDEIGEDMRQIDAITELLGKNMGMNVAQFTSKEDSYTRDLLRRKFFDGDYLQALVAIKCLDEGVNIPAIKTAFILASTTNPKEYIQRRGRVLRKYPGKEFAIIYDFITLPRPLDEAINLTYEEIKCEKSMVRNEVNRMIEFNRLAMSKMEADKLIYEITDTYRLNEDDKLDDNIEMEEIYYE